MEYDQLSEQSKVELMKLAVGLAQHYVPKSSGSLDRMMLRQIGLEADDASLLDVIDHFYRELAGRVTP